MFHYLLHNMLFSNKVINRKNHKCPIHESTTWFSDIVLYLNSPLHRVVHILTSWDQDDT